MSRASAAEESEEMKPYNATKARRDHLTCEYGCCQSHKNLRDSEYRRRAKKAARREGKQEVVLCLGQS
jgi:hypothetical protein